MNRGYVLVRFPDGIVEPAVVTSARYLKPGQEVILSMLDGAEETATVVTEIEGFLHPEEAIATIAKLFCEGPEDLLKIVGTIDRYYWEADDENEK